MGFEMWMCFLVMVQGYCTDTLKKEEDDEDEVTGLQVF